MRRTLALAAIAAVAAAAATPVAAVDVPRPYADDHKGRIVTDAVPPRFVEAGPTVQAAGDEFDGDPLRIVVWPNDVRRYTLGTDRFGVYVCTGDWATGGLDINAVTASLSTNVTPFYTGLSESSYNPVFIKRTVVTLPAPGYEACADAVMLEAADHPLWDDAGAIAALDNRGNGGLGGPGFYCNNCQFLNPDRSRFPGNERWAVVDGGAVASLLGFPTHVTTAAHEIGHTISFPHSYSGESSNEYDNPIDYMSGNLGELFLQRADEPYGSLAFNRYRAGWINPSDVVFYSGGVIDLTVAPVGVAGTQMVIVPTGYEYSFVALDARLSSPLDPIPESFEGVSAHYIEQWCKATPTSSAEPCGGLSSRPYSYPPSPDAIDHVTPVGGEARLDVDQGEELLAQGARLRVLEETTEGLVIRLIGFDDVAASVFLDDILWLAESGITRGCTETSYCPAKNVTRGQMAAFLVRALGYADDGGGNLFVDDDDSTFELDIDKLATAGVTRGCNPPLNDSFCPDKNVTREQMAAFLVRALDLTDNGGGNTFVDDDESIFQEEIARLAAAGITTGCNPPDNDMFCPTKPVTREQMAAFLRRALS
ncbi:MAG: S-layer homology domain-containing protein [Acidimicrobiia bacterium]|nr:S-layer homology domain-containing protein [Acidimicrobiia bacterium]